MSTYTVGALPLSERSVPFLALVPQQRIREIHEHVRSLFNHDANTPLTARSALAMMVFAKATYLGAQPRDVASDVRALSTEAVLKLASHHTSWEFDGDQPNEAKFFEMFFRSDPSLVRADMLRVLGLTHERTLNSRSIYNAMIGSAEEIDASSLANSLMSTCEAPFFVARKTC